MIKYQRNNIFFRITSSDAISKFKTRQAQSFVQLARKDLEFDESAREVVLLEFDRISQWILRIERICLSAQEGIMPDSMRLSFQDSLQEEIIVIENVIDSHPEVFCPVISNYVKLIHSYAIGIARGRMDISMKETTDRAFEQLVCILSDYLEHILICMHELNNNYIHRRPPFISITNYSQRLDTHDMFQPFTSRAKFFKDLGCGSVYVVKNYSDHGDIFAEAQAFAGRQGIDIVEEQPAEEAQVEYA